MRNLLQLLLTLLVAGAMAWVVWQGYLVIASKGATLEPVTRALLAIAGVLILVCTFILSSAIRTAGRERSRESLMQRRTELYEAFVILWQATVREVAEQGGTHLDLQADELKGSLGLYAGTEVLTSINKLMATAAEHGIAQCQDEYEDVIFQMRADIGNTNLYPIRAELNKLFANSPKNVSA